MTGPSKVLAKKIKLASKTQRVLTAWLMDDKPARESGGAQELGQLVDRLLDGSDRRRMQIMQLLRILDRLTR